MPEITNPDALTAPYGSFRRLTRVEEPNSYMAILQIKDMTPAAGFDSSASFHIILLGPWERDQIVDNTHRCGATSQKDISTWCDGQGWPVQSYYIPNEDHHGVVNRCVANADVLKFGEFIQNKPDQLGHNLHWWGMSKNLILARYRALNTIFEHNLHISHVIHGDNVKPYLVEPVAGETLPPQSNTWIFKCRRAPTRYGYHEISGWGYTNDRGLVLKIAESMGRDFEVNGLRLKNDQELKVFVIAMDRFTTPFGVGHCYHAPEYPLAAHSWVVRSENVMHEIESNEWVDDMIVRDKHNQVVEKKEAWRIGEPI